MTGLLDLWLPILLSSVLVFIVSGILHMATPWHKSDFALMPMEDKLRDAVRPLAIPPGDYMVPCPRSMQDMKSPEFAEKLKSGPKLILTVLPNGPTGMGQALILWFFYSVVMGIFAAYIAGRALPMGAEYLKVFRFTGATAFIGYAAALWQMSIWYRRSCVTTIKSTIDGLIYALLTAGVFGWLWPR